MTSIVSMPKPVHGRRGAWLLPAMLPAILLHGCAGSVGSVGMTGFGRSTAAIGDQAEIVLVDANRIGREAAVEEFIRQGRPGLTEAAFPPLVPPEVAGAWLDALGGLERYGLLIASLTDPERGAATTAAFGDVATQLNKLGAGISPGAATGFAGLGGAIVRGAAQRRARDFLRATDPHVRVLLTAMADAVGASDAEGLRGTVRVNWTRTFGPLQNAYALAAERRDDKVQRATIAAFLDRADRRDAELRSLASFRLSLLALADAHSAAAAGSQRPAGELLAVVERRLDETHAAYQAIAKEDRR